MSSPGRRRIMHFTLGPVQDFIVDARRTRDFWAGSFLLSLLSGHAMKALRDRALAAKDEVIIFPNITDDALFAALNGRGGAPHVGSLPNRFKADVSNVPGDPGVICKEAVSKAWDEICDNVWDTVIKCHAHNGYKTKEIWERQVKGFWDMAWVIGEEPERGMDGSWLDIRKNWRTHFSGKDKDKVLGEGGDHCRLMGQYQELSGYFRTKAGDKDKQKKFWEAVAGGKVRDLDLQKDERLCAIALIKRLYPSMVAEPERFFSGVKDKSKVFPVALPWLPGRGEVGIRGWPSTSYIAAVPWLKAVKTLPLENWEGLPAAAKQSFESGYKGETDTKLYNLPARELFALDGHLLHRDGIVAYLREEFPEDAEARKKPIDTLTAALNTLAAAVGKNAKPVRADGKHAKPVFASEFYAILRMDGDGIGKLLPTHEGIIKDALSKFTMAVTKHFSPTDGNKHDGALVYAGGDDVLALLPVDTAIEAALELRDLYLKAFRDAGAEEGKFTVSASIIYSHFKNPLSAVLRQSSHFLDKVAKETNGRNSLALAVVKPGGVAAQWVSIFEDDGGAIRQLEKTAKSGLGESGDAGLSGGFFHSLRQNYAPLFGNMKREADDFADDSVLKTILIHEIKNQFDKRFKEQGLAEEMAHAALQILRPQKREKQNDQIKNVPQLGVAFDGGLIARFLSAEGRWSLNTKSAPANGGAES